MRVLGFWFSVLGRRGAGLACATLLGPAAVAADELAPRTAALTGNAHYQAGNYAEALEAYAQVEIGPQDPAYADVLHNQAAARFKLGAYADARELWVRVASLKDAAFEARTRYNIGNTHYAEALAALEQRGGQGAAQPGSAPAAGGGGAAPPFPPGTPNWSVGGAPPGGAPGDPAGGNPIESLDRAIENYRDALRLDAGLANARANLELAARLKQQLEQQAQPSSQPSDQEQEQQDQQQDEQQEQSQEQSQPGENQQDQQQDQQDAQDKQQQPADRPSDEQQQEQQQQQPDQPAQPEGSPQDEQRGEPNPQDAMPQPSDPQQQQAEPTEAPAVNMSPAEAERLLQMIRDLEKARRELLRAREAAGHKPVEKDW